ncbi:DUF3533 domain-containing protein [Streptomyces aidingensis]|uniref:DUF3533 domain-containing protein n=1 Tax=Streptomyces aidingensis TaxID=910347 RepID=A0A1I1IZ09_9ACTN|nr:DUF3533 domain-containing protein [Streptomyces aidingensis]SFC38913.1 hypothetical protein SAMN05421773_103161 [Streptomyces aidingensis]
MFTQTGERHTTGSGRGPVLPEEPAGAVPVRAALLILGVLALQLGFILSWTGALHRPEPRHIPIAVVAPEQIRAQTAERLDALPGAPLDTGHRAADQREARARIENREIAGALIVDPAATTDTLLLASGGGAVLAEALRAAVTGAAEAAGRELRVADVVPARGGDSRGPAPFCLVAGWCVGGCLGAAALAAGAGGRPAGPRRAGPRLLALAAYAVAGGTGGALLAGPLLGAVPGGLPALSALGALVVFATGAATLALHGLFGTAGLGLAALLVAVLGGPSAGGLAPGPLLPPFWQDIGPALIPGAGVWSVRSVAYFDGRAMGGPLLVLALWAVAGTLVALLAGSARLRAAGRDPLARAVHG